MRAAERWILAAAGLAGFLVLWQAVVAWSRPAPIRRTTMGLALVPGDSVCAAVVDARGRVAAATTLGLDPGGAETSAGTLRLWFGSLQPSLLAMPPETKDGSTLYALVQSVQASFGGGLEVSRVAVAPASARCADAIERARLLQAEKARRPAWLPSPAEAFGALGAMTASGEILRHAVASLFRVGAGFLLAAVIGVPLGILLGSYARLSAVVNSVIQCLRPISPIAWLPVATLVLGGGDLAAVFLILLAAVFPIIVATAAAVAAVDDRYRRSALNFGVRGLAFARRVVFPAALPGILTGLRIALGISWVVVVAAEMLGVESGLGFLVLDARNQLRYDRVVAAMIVIGVIGLCIDAVVRRMQTNELARRGVGNP